MELRLWFVDLNFVFVCNLLSRVEDPDPVGTGMFSSDPDPDPVLSFRIRIRPI